MSAFLITGMARESWMIGFARCCVMTLARACLNFGPESKEKKTDAVDQCASARLDDDGFTPLQFFPPESDERLGDALVTQIQKKNVENHMVEGHGAGVTSGCFP